MTTDELKAIVKRKDPTGVYKVAPKYSAVYEETLWEVEALMPDAKSRKVIGEFATDQEAYEFVLDILESNPK